MTSEKKAAANRRNALKSTGPRTAEGKKRASLNSLRHGLRASTMAVPHLEDPEDWETHRRLVVQDLAPVGYLETVLSERIAATLWRLGRVVRYESEVVSIAMDEASERYAGDSSLEDLQDELQALQESGKTLSRVHGLKPSARVTAKDACLVLDLVAEAWGVDLYAEDCPVPEPPGIPEGTIWDRFNGWTRALVEKVALDIRAASQDPGQAPDPWTRALPYTLAEAEIVRRKYEGEKAKVDTKRRKALLPEEKTLDRVSRYETTLERSLFRTLHELHRLQAVRSGANLLPPAAVDLDVSVHQEAS